MEKIIEIFADGQITESINGKVIKVTTTEHQIPLLIKALELTGAKTFKISSQASYIPESVPRGIDLGSAPPRHINQEGINLIKAFESLFLDAYLDPVDIWTIGYGHTKTARPGMRISEAEAENLLYQDLAEFEAGVSEVVTVELNDNQFAALVSFCFNLGVGSLLQSTLLKLLNQGNYRGAAEEFPKWNKAGGQALLGLTRRRRAERALFLGTSWREFLNYQEVSTRILSLIQPRMQGNDVLLLQQKLKNLGYAIKPDGIFGQNTDRVIKQFQRERGLPMDGVVGPQTRTALGI